MLKRNLPALKSDQDQHYADILTSLYKRRLREMREEVSRHQGGGETPGTEVKLGTDQEREIGSTEGRAEAAQRHRDKNQIEKCETDGKKETRDSNGDGKSVKAADTRAQIDKSALPIGTARRIRDKEHLCYVAQQPCLICGRSPGHAHHLRFAQPRALGRKVSDEWVVPLCATHHRALHGVGDEERWWKEMGIEPIGHANRLWYETRYPFPKWVSSEPTQIQRDEALNASRE